MKQSPSRHVVVTNLTSFDQNFALLLMPGNSHSIPNIGAQVPAIWMNTIVPAMVSGIASQGSFSWREDFTAILGSIVSDISTKFISGTRIPISIDRDNSILIGFTGSVSNGAPKLIKRSSEPGDRFSMATTDSIPTANEQTSENKLFAFAWGISANSSTGGAAICGQLLPNIKVLLTPLPHYSILTIPFDAVAGDILQEAFTETACPFDFNESSTVQLRFLADNTFAYTG